MPILQGSERVEHQRDARFHIEHAGASQLVAYDAHGMVASVPSG
jgi:hypothetical protein